MKEFIEYGRLLVAMLCEVCSLPSDVCVCEDIVRSQTTFTVSLDKRRYGKVVTVIEGVNGDVDGKVLLKSLKRKCAAGGTMKGGCLEIQGDHRMNVTTYLQGAGYRVVNGTC